MEESDDTLAPIVQAMKDKFLKYWEHVPPVTIIANCLHPTYKKFYAVKMLRFYNNNLGIASGDEDAFVTKTVEDMFNLYFARRGAQQPASTSRSGRTQSSDGLLSALSESSDAMYNTSNELNIFYGLPGEPEGADVLEYWKNSSNLFPTLARMAHDIFAIPMSTVPSESCFSSANRILTDKRSKLGPQVFERLVCLKDWIDAENREQYNEIEATTSGAETQESNPDPDSDDECEPEEETDLWYMRSKNN